MGDEAVGPPGDNIILPSGKFAFTTLKCVVEEPAIITGMSVI